jgi:hypothetical protein
MSPAHDYKLPTFVAKLSPQHAELCTRGRQLRARLPVSVYLEQQQASVRRHCPLLPVLQDMVTGYALPSSEDLMWSDGLQWLDSRGGH